MAWPIFGGFFLYTEHAPVLLQVAFYVACACDLVPLKAWKFIWEST